MRYNDVRSRAGQQLGQQLGQQNRLFSVLISVLILKTKKAREKQSLFRLFFTFLCCFSLTNKEYYVKIFRVRRGVAQFGRVHGSGP